MTEQSQWVSPSLARSSYAGGGALRVAPVVWALVVASVARVTVFLYKRPTSEFAEVNPTAFVAMGLTLAGLAAVALAPATRRVWPRVRSSSFGLLFAYYGFCLASALWSANAGFSAYRAVEALVQISLVTLGVYYARDLISAERLFLLVSVAMVTMSVVGRLRLYSFELSARSLHSNQYPVIAAAAALYCLGEFLRAEPDAARRRRLRNWGIAFGLLAIMGTSAGTMVAIVCGLFTVGILQRFDRRILVLGACALIVILYFSGISREFWWDVLFRGKEYEDVVDLSGRRGLFEAYLEAAREKPILGYGFAVGARIGDRFGTVATTHAHNGFLEMLLGGGIVGVFLGLRWLVRLLREVLRSIAGRSVGGVGFAAAFVVLSVNNLSITAYGGAWSPSLTQLALLLAMFCFFIRGAQPTEGARAGPR